MESVLHIRFSVDYWLECPPLESKGYCFFILCFPKPFAQCAGLSRLSEDWDQSQRVAFRYTSWGWLSRYAHLEEQLWRKKDGDSGRSLTHRLKEVSSMKVRLHGVQIAPGSSGFPFWTWSGVREGTLFLLLHHECTSTVKDRCLELSSSLWLSITLPAQDTGYWKY